MGSKWRRSMTALHQRILGFLLIPRYGVTFDCGRPGASGDTGWIHDLHTVASLESLILHAFWIPTIPINSRPQVVWPEPAVSNSAGLTHLSTVCDSHGEDGIRWKAIV